MSSSRLVSVTYPMIMIAALLLVSIFAASPAALPSTYDVSIVQGSSSKTSDAYSPNPINISVGDTVKWTNDDSNAHSVTSGSNGQPDGNFDSSPNFNPIMAPGATFSHTFNQEGTFPYYCGLHPNMVGVVNVDEEDDEEEEKEPDLVSTVDKISYETGEKIMITGNGAPGEYITFTLTDPNGVVRLVDQFLTDSDDGDFSYSFSIAESYASAGQWKIQLKIGNLSNTRILYLELPDEPEDEGFPMLFSRMMVEDVAGNRVQGQLSVGQQVVIAFRAVNTDDVSLPYTAIIQITDSDLNTNHITWTTGTANAGWIFGDGFSWSPENAGSYTAKAFLWSSLSSPNPLAEPRELDISVIDVT